jgi:hypothetical protein
MALSEIHGDFVAGSGDDAVVYGEDDIGHSRLHVGDMNRLPRY